MSWTDPCRVCGENRAMCECSYFDDPDKYKRQVSDVPLPDTPRKRFVIEAIKRRIHDYRQSTRPEDGWRYVTHFFEGDRYRDGHPMDEARALQETESFRLARRDDFSHVRLIIEFPSIGRSGPFAMFNDTKRTRF